MSQFAASESREQTADGADGGHRMLRGIVWFAVLAVLAVWVAVARVPTFRSGGLRGTARVWDIVRALHHELPLAGGALLVLVVALVIGCAWALWLALTVTNGATPSTGVSRPPGWAIGALGPLAIIAVALVHWADPRDDVTGAALIHETGVEPTMLPTACAGFLDRAAALRSGDLRAGQAERTAGADCRSAVATAWPTETPLWPTQTALWSTVEAVARSH